MAKNLGRSRWSIMAKYTHLQIWKLLNSDEAQVAKFSHLQNGYFFAIIEEIASGYRHNTESYRQKKIPFNYFITLRLNIAVNCSLMRLNNSWMAVVFPIKVAAIFKPRGGMSQTAVLMLLGIHSTKYELHVSMKEMGAINY